MASSGSDRLAPPIIQAFRVTHSKRDARAPLEGRDGGERLLASRRLSRTPVSEAELRDLVKSDLLSLLNTTCLGSAEDLSEAPEVRASVLNFGFRDLASRSIDQRVVADIEREIEEALRDFEPRLVQQSIKARRDEKDSDTLRVRFLISAELRNEPVNLPVEFVAEVELDSGKVRLDRL